MATPAEARWNREGQAYLHGINRFLDRIYADKDPGSEPKDTRRDLGRPVLAELARLHAAGESVLARRRFRPAWEPFAEQTLGPAIARAIYLDDARIAVRTGQAHQDTACHVIDGERCTILPGVIDIGRSADRRWFARLFEDRIDVSEGWDAAPIRFRLPRTYAPIFEAAALGDRALAVGRLGPESMAVWSDGSRVLLVTTTGVFVCYPDRDAALLWPSGERVAAEAPPGATQWDAGLSYAHAAVSADGRYLAFGDQDSMHELMLRDGSGARSVSIEPVSEYPNAACFHDAEDLVALSSCHFARSGVVQHRLAALSGHFAGGGEGEQDAVILTGVHWIVALAPRPGGWILGDRNGYLWYVDTGGANRGYVHLGSTCLSLETSPDGTRVLAGMFAGHLVELAQASSRSRDHITNLAVSETRRWLFTDLHGPLLW
jgi:hypothetical protein